jgi:hypothetical protein
MESLDYLERITTAVERIAAVNNRSSFNLLISGNTTNIITQYIQPIQLEIGKQYEMALVSLDTYYSFPNVDATNNNFRYSPDNGTTWKDILIPTGAYELEAINNYVQRTMKDNGDYDSVNDEFYITILPDNNTLRSIVNITNPTYQVDFNPPNSIRTLLGFDAGIILQGYNVSQNIVNILSITSIRITSNIISGSYSNGDVDNIIYSFFPDVGPGFKIIQTPSTPIYLPITSNQISTLITTMTDQTGKLIDLRGEDLNITFHVREKV